MVRVVSSCHVVRSLSSMPDPNSSSLVVSDWMVTTRKIMRFPVSFQSCVFKNNSVAWNHLESESVCMHELGLRGIGRRGGEECDSYFIDNHEEIPFLYQSSLPFSNTRGEIERHLGDKTLANLVLSLYYWREEGEGDVSLFSSWRSSYLGIYYFVSIIECIII